MRNPRSNLLRFGTAPLLGLSLGLFSLGPVAQAEVVEITASRDGTLYQTGGDVANGAGEYLISGRTAAGPVRRAILSFDVKQAVPAGATILSATLKLHVSQTISLEQEFSLHTVNSSWSTAGSNASDFPGQGAPAHKADVTWASRFHQGQSWKNLGGDFDPLPSATLPVGFVGDYAVSSAGIMSDVQGWLDQPSANHGWILIGPEDVLPTAKRLDSSENATPKNRPRLRIEFTTGSVAAGAATPIPTMGEWGMILMGVLLLAAGVLAITRRSAAGSVA